MQITDYFIANDFDQIINKIDDIMVCLKKYYKEIKKEEYDGCFVIMAKNIDTKRHLILQSGLHGIEGYVGFAMISYFIENLIDTKVLQEYDITFIINANPYGVRNKRRVNENNVDLNRNFLEKDEDFIQSHDDYYLVDDIINPKKKVKSFYLSYLHIIIGILNLVLKIGAAKFKHILLCGQKYNSHGAYYMGDGFQKQTIFLKNLYQKLFNIKGLEKTVFIDLHTGYGPSYQMSIVNSSYMKNEKLSDYLNQKYPLVVQSNTDSFYEMKGDLIDFIYKSYPEISFATSFEFGTFGDSTFAGIKSIIAIVLENQYFYNNLDGRLKSDSRSKKFSEKDKLGNKIQSFYEKAYFPKKKKWWDKAIKDFSDAINIILNN